MDAAFIIEKGIPFPPIDGRHGRSGPRGQRVYHWERLEKGDSVLVAGESGRVSAFKWARAVGRIFVSKHTQRGIRIWRVA